MKISPGAIPTFLAQPPVQIRVFLIHGPDGGLVNERVRLVTRALNRPVRTLLGEKLTEGQLVEAALNRNLLEPDPCLVIEQIDDAAMAGVLKNVLPQLAKAHPIILAAPEPPACPALRTLCQNSPLCAAVGCYPESVTHLRALVRKNLKPIPVTDAALIWLVDYGRTHRHLLEQEIDKIVLYKQSQAKGAEGGPSPLTLEEVHGLCGDGHEKNDFYALFDTLIQALYRAHYPTIRLILTHSPEPASLISMLAYHFQRLLMVHLFAQEGKPYEEAIGFLKPPLHFSVKEFFAQQLKRWPKQQTQAIVSALFHTELSLRRGGFIHFERVLYDIAKN